MSDAPHLAAKRCVPCEGGVAALSRADCEKLLGTLASGWTLSADATEIAREFRFRDFFRAMSFANAVGHVANVEDHHPDLEVGYGRCRVRYTTHAIKGLSENDFICAAKIDMLPVV